MITETLHSTTRQNARTWGNKFSSRFLEAGIVSYEDSGGDKELLRHETIQKCAESFVGRPVIIRHSKVTPETMEGKACGYISRVWFEPSDGWFYCEGIITNDEAKNLVRSGWSVSCSYRVTDTDECRGNYHNIPYVRELTSFDGEHLALVESPRYEGATIRLNAKTKTPMNVFKLFKKLFVAPRDNSAALTPEQVAANAAAESTPEEISAESLVEVTPGKSVPLGAVVTRYNEACAEDEEQKQNEAAAAEQAKKDNEAAEQVKKDNEAAAAKEKEQKDNEAAAAAKEKETKDNEARENALKKERDNAAFQTLASAGKTTPVNPDRTNSAETEDEKLARGRQRYGSSHGKN